MFQIDNSTAVAAIPAPTPAGSAGYFTDGNPTTGVSATILPAEFMNMLMMENMNILAAAGIAPAKGQYNQLALAIAKIVQGGAAGQASEATAGILKLSTNPQALAGTDDSTAITPLKLAQKLANFLGQATEVAFGWLKIATQALVNAGADDATAVTPKKLAAAIQSQALTAFTTAGSAGALTLTPVPAIQAYATPLRFRVKFSQNSTGTDTINVSGQGAKNLKQYDSTGAKVAAVFAANQLADVEYDGTDAVLLDQLPLIAVPRRQSQRGAAVNWKASADGVSTSIVCSADSVILANAAGDPTAVSTIAITLNTAATASATIDGMASGATVANTWYGIYVWTNSTTGAKRVTGDSAYTTGLAPIPPAAGFDFWARRSAFRTDSTANKYPIGFTQSGDLYQPRVAAASNVPDSPILGSGVAGNPTVPTAWVALPVAGVLAGPSAVSVRVSTMISNGAAIAVAPNNAHSGTNGASTDIGAPVGGVGQATAFLVASISEILLESSSIYWASSAAIGRVRFAGWRDAL